MRSADIHFLPAFVAGTLTFCSPLHHTTSILKTFKHFQCTTSVDFSRRKPTISACQFVPKFSALTRTRKLRERDRRDTTMRGSDKQDEGFDESFARDAAWQASLQNDSFGERILESIRNERKKASMRASSTISLWDRYGLDMKQVFIVQ